LTIFLAGILFIGSSVLNLGNPVGMVGQIIGNILFGIQILAFYTSDSGPFSHWIEGSDMHLEVLFAVASIALCFIARSFGACEDRDIYQ
jgi:hypothetical protein